MAVEELRRWRVLQAQELLRLGVRADDSWHVVTQADGSPLQPRSLTHVMSDFLKEWDMTEHVPPFLDRNRDAQKRCAFAALIDLSIL